MGVVSKYVQWKDFLQVKCFKTLLYSDLNCFFTEILPWYFVTFTNVNSFMRFIWKQDTIFKTYMCVLKTVAGGGWPAMAAKRVGWGMRGCGMRHKTHNEFYEPLRARLIMITIGQPAEPVIFSGLSRPMLVRLEASVVLVAHRGSADTVPRGWSKAAVALSWGIRCRSRSAAYVTSKPMLRRGWEGWA